MLCKKARKLQQTVLENKQKRVLDATKNPEPKAVCIYKASYVWPSVSEDASNPNTRLDIGAFWAVKTERA